MASTGRIVVADRDPALRRVLAQRLEAEGYDVRSFEDAAEYFRHDAFAADALIVTVAPGGTNPLTLEGAPRVPLLAMLPRDTAPSDALDLVDSGADDYVIKPFSPRELVTRLRAILRRTQQSAVRPPQFVFDGLAIDPDRREVLVGGIEVVLPAKEFDLLAFLAASPKQVFTRVQLMNHVWGTDAAVSTATVTEHIRRLRHRIEVDPTHPRWIQTVWSVGYRFNP